MFSWMKRWPRAAMISFGGLLLALGWSAWGIYGLWNLEPEPRIDYASQLVAFLEANQPEGENVWLKYDALFKKHFGNDYATPWAENDLSRFLRSSELLYGPWDEIPRDHDVAILNEYRPILDEFEPLVSTRWLAPPLHLLRNADNSGARQSILEMPLLSELGAHMDIRTLNLMVLRVAAESGDWDEAVERFQFGVWFWSQDRRPLLFNRHIAVREIGWMFRDFATLLGEHDVPVEASRELLQFLTTFDWRLYEFDARAIDAEQFLYRELVQHLFSRDGLYIATQDSLRYTDGAPADHLVSPWLLTAKRETELLQYWASEFREAAEAPYSERRARLSNLEQELQERNSIWARYTYAPQILNDVDKASTLRAGLGVMLRLEIHHGQTGEWPASLLDIMDEPDTLDPVTGEPFRYSLTPDDEYGREYILEGTWSSSQYEPFEINEPRWPVTSP